MRKQTSVVMTQLLLFQQHTEQNSNWNPPKTKPLYLQNNVKTHILSTYKNIYILRCWMKDVTILHLHQVFQRFVNYDYHWITLKDLDYKEPAFSYTNYYYDTYLVLIMMVNIQRQGRVKSKYWIYYTNNNSSFHLYLRTMVMVNASQDIVQTNYFKTFVRFLLLRLV